MSRARFPLLLLGFLSPYAYASDYTGFIAAMYLIIVVSISTVINIGLIISFYASQKYENISFAKKHAGIAIVIPLLGMVLTLIDHRTTSDLLYSLGLNGLAALIALIPLFIRKRPIKNADKVGINMLVLSGIFGVIALTVLAPASIAAIITGHIAINKNESTLRTYSIVIVAISYVFVAYWLYTLFSMFL